MKTLIHATMTWPFSIMNLFCYFSSSWRPWYASRTEPIQFRRMIDHLKKHYHCAKLIIIGTVNKLVDTDLADVCCILLRPKNPKMLTFAEASSDLIFGHRACSASALPWYLWDTFPLPSNPVRPTSIPRNIISCEIFLASKPYRDHSFEQPHMVQYKTSVEKRILFRFLLVI